MFIDRHSDSIYTFQLSQIWVQIVVVMLFCSMLEIDDIVLYTCSNHVKCIFSVFLHVHRYMSCYSVSNLPFGCFSLGEINRKLLDVYGTKASTLYPHFYPDCTTWKQIRTVT